MFRRIFCHSTLLAATLAVFTSFGMVNADDPIVRVEEDWELTVKLPDLEVTAPQIIMAITPLEDLADIHATFEINHLSSVAYSPGGLHLSTWRGETHLAVVHAGNFATMYSDGESVSWTQAMSISDGTLTFEILSGDSTTWGKFGAPGSLKLSLNSELSDLSDYSPAVSADKSEVSYASNRVQQLVLRKVRYIHASGQTTSENATRYVHQEP